MRPFRQPQVKTHLRHARPTANRSRLCQSMATLTKLNCWAERHIYTVWPKSTESDREQVFIRAAYEIVLEHFPHCELLPQAERVITVLLRCYSFDSHYCWRSLLEYREALCNVAGEQPSPDTLCTINVLNGIAFAVDPRYSAEDRSRLLKEFAIS